MIVGLTMHDPRLQYVPLNVLFWADRGQKLPAKEANGRRAGNIGRNSQIEDANPAFRRARTKLHIRP